MFTNRRSFPVRRSLVSVLVAGCLLTAMTSCASSGGSAPSPEDAAKAAKSMAAECGGTDQAWQDVITAAQQEGTLVTTGPPDPNVTKDVPAAFAKAFGIKVNYIGGTSSSQAVKLKSEREAGISSVDTFLGGANTMYTVIYKSGWLDDLKSKVISPKLLDPATWAEGKVPFKDPEGNKIWTISKYREPAFVVNTDVAKDVTGWAQMLDPKYKGKIAIQDPSSGAGLGFNVALELYSILGPDYLKKLFVDQQPVFIDDARQAADGVAKGKYDIGIGISRAVGGLDDLMKDGLPIEPRNADDAPNMVNSGYGLLSLMTNAPHPKAAQLFANWLLCPSGNAVWNKAGNYGSSRADVPTDIPAYSVFDPKAKYWDTYGWDLVAGDEPDKVSALVKQYVK